MGKILFHATSTLALESISTVGLNPLSYWSNDPDITAYYAETVDDEGLESCVLEIDLDELLAHVGEDAIEPDFPGIDEPICSVLGKSEQAVMAEWRAGSRDWRESLAVVHSIRVRAPIPANLLRLQDGCTLSELKPQRE